MPALNTQNHYLKFTLNGIPKPVVYRVSKETRERVSGIFATMNDFNLNNMGVEFDTLAGRVVNVNPRHVLMCHALWDVGRLASVEEEERDLILYVHGFSEPRIFLDSDLEELASMASTIQHAAFDLSAFVGITDEDGEVLYVRSDRVMLMDSVDYSSVLEEEAEEYEAELKETKAKRPRGVKRAPKPKTQPARGPS